MSRIIIVGGSLGGLMAGIALKRLGRSVTIFERSPTALLHDQGAGIVPGGNTEEFFKIYDLTGTPLVVRSPYRQYLDKEGNVLQKLHQPQSMTSWDLLYHVLRANFDGVKSSYLKDPPVDDTGYAEYCHGHKVETVEETEDGRVEVTYTDLEGKIQRTIADWVVAADGPSSSVRHHLLPKVERKYAGYVAFRGTVPETELSPTARDTLAEKFTFYLAPAVQILSYLIPGKNGVTSAGQRNMNWVWYLNIPEGSPEWKAAMTDTEGKTHRYTLPHGKMRPETWSVQKSRAIRELPPVYAELVEKTKVPFIQAIADVLTTKATFLDGRVVLLGDAVAGLRPHTAAGTSQAAGHAILLADLVERSQGTGLGAQLAEEYEGAVMGQARILSKHGIRLGAQNQFGHHPFLSENAKNSALSPY